MRILVDADACPVKDIIVKLAKSRGVHVIMLCDTSHVLHDGYSEIITVDKAQDSVDIALVNRLKPSDVVISQDYGVAAMSLGKGCRVFNQNGQEYDDNNIDRLLFERHLSQKIRRSGGRTSGNRKRSKDDDVSFEAALLSVLDSNL